MNKLIITMGLPGSGKTYFSNEYSKKRGYYNYNCFYIDPDFEDNKTLEEINLFRNMIKQFLKNKAEILIDGLFLTNNDIINILNIFADLNFNYSKYLDVEIHFWNEDRESCLWNDVKRRSVPSSAIIRNAILEKPDLIYLNNVYKNQNINFIVIEHNVVRKETIQMIKDEYELDINNKNILISKSWETGKSSIDFNGNKIENHQGSPMEFVELYSFLHKLSPKLSQKQLSLIDSECISLSNYTNEDDYYGCVNYSYYECNFEKLLELLESFDYDLEEVADMDIIMSE